MTTAEQNAGQPWSHTTDALGCDVFQVRSGDRWPDDPDDRNRSEVTDGISLPFDTDLRATLQLCIDPGPVSTAPWCVLGQFHQTEDKGESGLSPAFEQQYVDGCLCFYARGGEGKSMAATTTTMLGKVSITRGEWLHLTHLIRFARTGLGHIETWCNGSQLFVRDVPFGYDDKRGPYWKHGIYRKASPEPLSVRYAGVTIGP